MRLTAILIAVALTVSSAWGQAALVSHEGYEAEIIHVKTLTGDSFNRLGRMLSVFDVKIAADENLRTIVVYGPKDVIAQMRRVVTELDTPGSEAAIGRNIEMTLTLLRCSTKPQGATKLPDDIEPVAKQLRAATQYKDIEFWDVIPLRLQEGKSTSNSLELPVIDGIPVTADIRIDTEAATQKEHKWSVRFRDVHLNFRIFSGGQQIRSMALSTSGDFLEGQKTVLGKVSGAETDTAVFVVISLKVLE